ncbi:PKD domain-containing protein [Ancylomarina sp. 16SWW S1-10-2]|uniref:PKD domain-containing protein n=1 Tax=Ancylomarina sp. 16SWW S1-10-2 TaxID=2499681 RepID=UPI0012AD7948|nr:PKD domain-containing protein [Ancylomarina sp. 16SWW S1-10-2]MRT94778.1 PKD domain-containing protein [Ancylomarina sp. 16SWW S1-10-2]
MTKSTVKSRQFRIDSMISNFFILLLIPLVALFGFKYFAYQAPPEVNFDILGDEHMMNEMLKFRNNTAGDHSYEWNFGDSTEFSQEKSPIHIFSKHGDYTVTLTVDDQYKFHELVHVEQMKEEKPMVVIPRIAGPKKMYVGASAFFTCSTKGGTSWAWRLNGYSKIYSKKKSIKLTFSKAGYKTISLEVDGNSEFTVKKKIYVGIKPSQKHKISSPNNSKTQEKEEYIPETPEEYTVFKNIEKENITGNEELLLSDDELTEMFKKIAKKTGNKKKFLKYFHDNNKYLMVKCNGDLISFEKLIKDVEGENIVIKEFSTETRNGAKIINVTIRYKKKRKLKIDLL